MLNLERPTAELIHILITATARKQILEIGTSNGYSMIWLANALQRTGGGALITIERSADKAQQARQNLQSALLQDRVQVMEGDATTICATLSGPFDCVFFDADRISAPDQLDCLMPKLTADALLLADNALSHPDEIGGYITKVNGLEQFDSVTVPVGKGLHIASRRRLA